MAAQKNYRCGFTIAELLVALAVTAILLTAVAVAFNASAINYNENTEMFKALNTGRQAMLRMTNQLRTANSASTTDPNSRCYFWTGDTPSLHRGFRYANNEVDLVYLDSAGNVTASYMLCENVADMKFTRTTGLDSNNQPCVKSVQMSMKITVGDNSQKVTGAVVLRKTL
jgi:prepilin-type N-terminal cleavage/methylation domain-containing protein